MDIGSKIRNARMKADLTQEQVAEALGVSRQTVSNWENGKTYPDIISVVKMSDLYHISLDHLLKEDKDMSTYLNYLEESTNTVKSHDRKAKTVLISVYLAIWAFAIIAFWLFTDPTDAMGYSLMYLWVLLPAVTFVVSLLIGKNNYFGKWKWLFTLLFGIMYMLAEYGTFSAANMISFDKINMPEFSMILTGAIISAIGLAIGCLINRSKSKKQK